MLAIMKRYSMALVFLLLVSILMLIMTLGVKSIGDSLLEETGTHMTPIGKGLN